MTIKNIGFWDFIYYNLPNYSSDPDVLWSDILSRYLYGEEVCADDLLRIESEFETKEEVTEELNRVDGDLFTGSLKAYCDVYEPIPLSEECYWDITLYCGGYPLGIIREEEDDLLIINAPKEDESGNDFLFEVVGNIDDDVMNRFNGLLKEVRRKGETVYDIAVHDRMEFLKESGLDLRFVRPVKPQANANLFLCGADMSKIVAAMLKHFYYDNLGGHTTMLDCIEHMAENDVLEYGLPEVRNIYYNRVSTFLYNSFTGMRLGSPWNGRAEVNGGYIVVKRDGDVVAYHSTIADEFKDFLVHRLTMEGPSHKRHKDMVIEKVDGKYYLKLALQLRFGMSSRMK